MSEDEFDNIMCVCPSCCSDVLDEKILSCEVCGKIKCTECYEHHLEKHSKVGV